jgi:hypothetical protein
VTRRPFHLFLLLLGLGGPLSASAAESVEGRPGIAQLFLFAEVPNAVASVILLPGGNGRMGVNDVAATDSKSQNFLVRARALFAAQGFNVATLDVPSDHRTKEGLEGFRASAEHASDIGAVAAFLKGRASVPVILIGTSRGTVSAANAAVRQAAGTYGAVVLTSSVTRPSRREPQSLKDVAVESIAIPALVVSHKGDRCVVSPPADAPLLLERLKAAPVKAAIQIEGGGPEESDPCEARSFHGYLHREAETVGAIAEWIKGAAK